MIYFSFFFNNDNVLYHNIFDDNMLYHYNGHNYHIDNDNDNTYDVVYYNYNIFFIKIINFLNKLFFI